MNIIFLGSSHFAALSLEALLNSEHKISCAVTQPDKKGGRGLHLIHTIVKDIALKNKLRIYQPSNINSQETIRFLRSLSPDLLVVVSYGQILSQAVLDIPKIIPINLHASLLPRYRGAAPMNWAIINGEKNTGVSVMRIIKKMDAGEIILQKKVDIEEDDTVITLEGRLSRIGADSLIEAIDLIEGGNQELILQDESKVSYAPKLTKKDGLLDWNGSAFNIHNRVQGCLGWPGAFTYFKNKLVKIYKTRVDPLTDFSKSNSPGEIIRIFKDGIVVATAKACLVIEELQIEGKRRMMVEEFIAGHKIRIGDILG